MKINQKRIFVRVFFPISILLLILAFFGLTNSLNYTDSTSIAKVYYFLKSFTPDKVVDTGSTTLTFKQPFWDVDSFQGDDQSSYLLKYPFGSVEYTIIDTVFSSWEDLALHYLNHSDFKDICATVYEYSTDKGNIYLYYDIDSLSFINYSKRGFKAMGMVFIPEDNLIVSFYNTRKDPDFMFEFSKSLISNDPNFKYRLLSSYKAVY